MHHVHTQGYTQCHPDMVCRIYYYYSLPIAGLELYGYSHLESPSDQDEICSWFRAFWDTNDSLPPYLPVNIAEPVVTSARFRVGNAAHGKKVGYLPLGSAPHWEKSP